MRVHDAGRERDSGAVTVEAALGICSVVAVFAVSLGGLGVVMTHLRCTDAAIEAARLVARGDRARAGTAVRKIAPAGARLRVTVRGDEVTTTVTAPPLGRLVSGYTVSSSAFAVMEPGSGASRGTAPETPTSYTREQRSGPGIVEYGEVRSGETAGSGSS